MTRIRDEEVQQYAVRSSLKSTLHILETPPGKHWLQTPSPVGETGGGQHNSSERESERDFYWLVCMRRSSAHLKYSQVHFYISVKKVSTFYTEDNKYNILYGHCEITTLLSNTKIIFFDTTWNLYLLSNSIHLMWQKPITLNWWAARYYSTLSRCHIGRRRRRAP